MLSACHEKYDKCTKTYKLSRKNAPKNPMMYGDSHLKQQLEVNAVGNKLLINIQVSGCVRMAYDSLLTTSLLQVVHRLLAR